MEKLTEIFRINSVKSVTVSYMEVPCCFGLVKATEEAMKASGKNIPFKKLKIGIRGETEVEDQEIKGSRVQGINPFGSPV